MRALRKKHSERKQSLTVNTQTANEGPGENDDDVFDAIFTANSRSFDSQSVDVSSRPVLHRSLSVGDILSKPKPPASVHSNASDDFVLGSPGPSEADLEEAECQAAYENLYTIAKGRGYSEDEVLGIVDHICSNNLFDDQGNVVFDLKAFRRDGSPEQPGEEEFHELADNSLVAKEIERYLLLGIYGPGVPSTRALLANPQPKSDPNARFDKLHSKRRHRYFNLRSRHRHPIYALHKSGISPMATIKAQPTPPTSPTGLSDNKAAPASHGEETKAVRTSSGSDDNDKTPTPSIYQLHNDAHTVKEAGESHGSSADVLTIPSTRIEPPAPQRIDSKLSSPVDGNFAFAPPLSSSPSYGNLSHSISNNLSKADCVASSNSPPVTPLRATTATNTATENPRELSKGSPLKAAMPRVKATEPVNDLFSKDYMTHNDLNAPTKPMAQKILGPSTTGSVPAVLSSSASAVKLVNARKAVASALKSELPGGTRTENGTSSQGSLSSQFAIAATKAQVKARSQGEVGGSTGYVGEVVKAIRTQTKTTLEYRVPSDPHHTKPPNRDHEVSSKTIKHPNHDRAWSSKNLRCIDCTGNCALCDEACCLYWAQLMVMRNNYNLVEEKKEAADIKKRIDRYMPTGLDEPTHLRCTEIDCGKSVCPECCSICPTYPCHDVACKKCKPNMWKSCDWHSNGGFATRI